MNVSNKGTDPRLALVRQCVERLWALRDDRSWASLEQALIDILKAREKARTRPATWRDDIARLLAETRADVEPLCSAPTQVSRSPAPPTPAGDNVIILTGALVTRMRRKA